MISFNNECDERDWDFQPRGRDRQVNPPERFRMTRVKTGRSTNQVRRSRRQPIVNGVCRRRLKKVR